MIDKDYIKIPCQNQGCAGEIKVPTKDMEGSNARRLFIRLNSRPQKCTVCGTMISTSSSDIVVNVLKK